MQRIILVAIVLVSMCFGFLVGGAVTASKFDKSYRELVEQYRGYFGE